MLCAASRRGMTMLVLQMQILDDSQLEFHTSDRGAALLLAGCGGGGDIKKEAFSVTPAHRQITHQPSQTEG
jgi:hypothetical protein